MTTPAEKQVDEAISAAVSENHPGHFVTGWVALAAVIGAENADGESSGVVWYIPDGMHWAQLLGLIEAVRLRLRQQYLDEFK